MPAAASPAGGNRPLSVTVFDDGKRGHGRQWEGLTAALAERIPLDVTIVPAPRLHDLPRALVRLRRRPPDLAIGAGHGSHWALAACRPFRRPRTIVLMKPSLPVRVFDLVIAPAHDELAPGPRILTSEGPLCPFPAATGPRAPGSVLVLLGGPSPHFEFDPARLADRLDVLLRARTGCEITLADSRRTPAGLAAELASKRPQLSFVSFDQAPETWLPRTLGTTEEVWVTPDSMSMIYEALTAGCRVGLLDLAPTPPSRVVRAMADLVAAGRVATLGDGAVVPAARAVEPFNEARRVAQRLVEDHLPRWGLGRDG